MRICIDCYQERGEKAMLPVGKVMICQFCDTTTLCYELAVHELQHWREVARYQGWSESYNRR